MEKEFSLEVAKESCTIAEFYEKNRNSLPVMFRVELGHYGATNTDEFGGGEVIWVNKESEQQRVVARDGEHRYYTVPVHSRHVCYVVRGHDKVDQMSRLGDIIPKENLPLQVQIVDPKSNNRGVRIVRDSTWCDEETSNWVLTECYNEAYLIGHSIDSTRGRPFEKPIFIPLFLDMLVAECTGLAGRPKLDWQAYMEVLNDFAENVNYDKISGYEEIWASTEKEIQSMKLLSEREYDFIQGPMTVTKKLSGEDREKIDELKKGFVKLQNKRSHSVDYGPPPPLPARRPSGNDDGPKGRKLASNAVSSVVDELSKKFGSNTKGSGIQGVDNQENPSVSPKDVASKIPDQPAQPQTRTTTTGMIVKTGRSGTLKNYGRLEEKPLKKEDNSYSSFPKDNNGNQNVSSPTTDESSVPSGKQDVSSPTARETSGPNGKQNVSSPTAQKSSVPSKSRSSCKSIAYSDNNGQREKIAAMTISDVCDKLSDLRLNKYADKFRKECVDGEILIHVDEDILKQDFGLKGIEAVRLMTFIRKGHIPK